MWILTLALLFATPLFSEQPSEVPLTDFRDFKLAPESSENLSEEPLNQFVNLNDIPSGIVANVNVITGHYCIFEQDLTIPSSQPIHIERIYSTSSGNYAHAPGPLFHHWQTNCEGRLFHPTGQEKQRYTLILNGPLGECGRYKRSSGERDYSFDTKLLCAGITNCNQGTLSGNTNIKNSKISREIQERYTFQHNPLLLHFYRNQHLDEIRLPNGNGYTYLTKPLRWNKETSITTHKVVAQNKAGQELDSLTIHHINDDGTGRHVAIFEATTGQQAIYKFHKHQDSLFLEHVTRPSGPDQQYSYWHDKKAPSLLLHTYGPDGRFLDLDYYPRKHIREDSSKVRRIKQLKAPVGPDNTPIVTHRFEYIIHSADEKNGIYTGCTAVYDAHHHKTLYHYADNRITRVTRLSADQKTPYSHKTLHWGKPRTTHEGNLLSCSIEDGLGNMLLCQAYTYDQKGNVLEETLYGNLTGYNAHPVLLSKEGLPQCPSCEHHTISLPL